MADYREMWESLGMDLETHDQLCEVLPQAFGDIFLSQENKSKKTELADVRQEVNELTRYDRLSQLASSQGMKLQKENRKTVSASSDE